ncbi:hypothetical protein C8R46DRAFT_1227367 [Mycena filopes]|nr:hypothetical protein C8R46DRAFT_1227367 [Mycena filopes]
MQGHGSDTAGPNNTSVPGSPVESPTDAGDNERFLHLFQQCFTNLAKSNEEQMEKLREAVDGLKPKPPDIDKKTAFWNAYNTVADEYDKEYQQKYGTDLDTSLIFSGLFSAVSSAFIIQIQPEIHPKGTSSPVVAAACLLYISLACTLLAALLAVLGKQWLMYYAAAGERGTIAARGLERQRKFDGLRRWKFDNVMQMFPLLLQFGFLLFALALSAYLWTVHVAIAITVLLLTLTGIAAYTFLLASAVQNLFSDIGGIMFSNLLVTISLHIIGVFPWS